MLIPLCRILSWYSGRFKFIGRVIIGIIWMFVTGVSWLDQSEIRLESFTIISLGALILTPRSSGAGVAAQTSVVPNHETQTEVCATQS